MAPIRRGDGTEITSVRRGDGTGISEIRRGDGTVVWSFSAIPDSAIAQYDASQEDYSDGDSVSTVMDHIGDYDLSGAGTFATDEQNGLGVIRLDETDDEFYITKSNWNTVSIPYTIIIALSDLEMPSDEIVTVFSKESSDDDITLLQWYGEDDEWDVNFGNPQRCSPDASPPLILSIVVDGSDGVFRENGKTLISDDFGNNSLESLLFGDSYGRGRSADADLCELVVYDANLDDEGELSTEENRLADKWNISL